MADTDQDSLPTIALRVPGRWDGAIELRQALPTGYGFSEAALTLPDGRGAVDVSVHAADKEFPAVFARACRRMPSRRDRTVVERYDVNVCLLGPGGSVETARRMIDAAAALVRAGGAGVFVDNSALAHGSDAWLDVAEDDGADALLYALVNRIRSRDELWSVGMHTLGARDALIARSRDDGADDGILLGFLGYLLECGAAVAEGDLVRDELGPLFHVRKEPCRRFRPDSPLRNPYGRWRLVPVTERA